MNLYKTLSKYTCALISAANFLLAGHGVAQVDFAPANDHFAQRTDLGSAAAAVDQTVFRATQEYSDPLPNSVWWQWTPPLDGWYEFHPSLNGRLSIFYQLYSGTQLASMLPLAGSTDSQLVRGKAGIPIQIGGMAEGFQNHLENRFQFRMGPAVTAVNGKAEAPVELAASVPFQWSGQQWSTGEQPSWTAPGGVVYSHANYWKWTPPDAELFFPQATDAAGRGIPYIVLSGTSLASSLPLPFELGSTYAYRPKPQEAIFIVTGVVPGIPMPALHRMTIDQAEATVEPGQNSSAYNITGNFPRTVSPPTGAPASHALLWRVTPTVNGWVEFEGNGLSITHMNSLFGEDPVWIKKNGKQYFWGLTTASYEFYVAGYKYPNPASFTLRVANLPVPGHDLLETALDLGTARVVERAESYLGARRSAGDPAATAEIGIRPTLWYKWQMPDTHGQVFLQHTPQNDEPPYDLPLNSVRVFQGTDPAYWSELPVKWVPPSELLPGHFAFTQQLYGSAFPIYICLSGMWDSFTLRMRAGKVAYGAVLPNNQGPVVELAGVVIDRAQYTWTAPANGFLRAVGSGEIQLDKLLRDPNFRAISSMQTPVTAGSRYTLEILDNDFGQISNPVEGGIRLLFEPAGQVPGDDRSAPFELVSTLPQSVRTALQAMTLSPTEAAMLPEGYQHPMRWFRWTPPVGTNYVALRTPNTVFVFDSSGAAVPIISSYAGEAIQYFQVRPLENYLMAVAGLDGASSLMHLESASVVASPADTFPGQISAPAFCPSCFTSPINNEATVLYSLSQQAGEPLADPTKPAAIHSAWFTYTARETGLLSPTITDPTHAVAVYEGDSQAALTRVPLYPSPLAVTAGTSATRWLFSAIAGKVYRVQVASPNALGGISVYVNPSNDYDIWANQYLGLDSAMAAGNANPSGDGMSNLMKFALGLNPNLPVSQDPAGNQAPQLTRSADGRQLRLRFRSERFHSSSLFLCDSVRLTAEVSSDLKTWTRTTAVTNEGNGWWTVNLPVSPLNPRRYMRLKASACSF